MTQEEIIEGNKDWGSIVRNNLMNREGYAPYCGSMESTGNTCPTPRTKFNGSQFCCPSCGWASKFEKEFIDKYKAKWQTPCQVNQ
jgi:hypothetical protein